MYTFVMYYNLVLTMLKLLKFKCFFDTNYLQLSKTFKKNYNKLTNFLEKLFKEDKHVKVPNVGNMTREERFVECVKRSTYFFKNFLTKNGWDYKSDGTFADRLEDTYMHNVL